MILNIVTTAYFLSMIVMAFWTNIRPIYVNDSWNGTNFSEYATQLLSQKNVSYKTKQELGGLDIIIVVINLVLVSAFGKWSSIRNFTELFNVFHIQSIEKALRKDTDRFFLKNMHYLWEAPIYL